MAYLVLAAAMSACSQPLSEQELLNRAQAAFAQGDVRAAIIDTKTALQQQPDNPSARQLLGELYAFQQNPVAAADEFERALQSSTDSELLVLYARSLVAAGRGEQLLELDAEQVFAAVSQHPQYMTALALAQLSSGDIPLAAQTLVSALQTGADDPYVATTYAFYLLLHEGGPQEAHTFLLDTVAQHPEYTEAWSLLADIQQIRGEYAAAETSYAKVVELNPYRLTDRLNLIMMHIEQGQLDSARARLKPLLANNPDHPGVNFIQGRLLMEAGDDPAALQAFAKTLNVAPRHPGSLYLAAIVNRRQGNLSTALSQLHTYLQVTPNDLNGRLQLSRLHLLMGSLQEAEHIARTILADYDEHRAAMALLAAAMDAQDLHEESIAIHQRIVALEPESLAAHMALGSALQQAGNSAASIASYRTAHDLDPNSSVVWEHLIQALIVNDDPVGASQEADAYARLYPDSPRPSLYLGGIAFDQDDFATAKQYFEKALALEPGNTVANSGLAALAMADKDLDQARSHYLNALAHHPEDTPSLLNLASIEAARGDFQAMESNLTTAVQSDTTSLPAHLSLARLKLDEGRSADAAAILMEIRDAHPQEPGLWLLLAEAQLAVGALDAASEAAHRLLRLLPDDQVALTTMARVELLSGQFASAETHLRQASAAQPDNSNLQKLLADALMSQGKLDEASATLAALPQDELNDPAVQVARGRIALAENNAAEAETFLRSAMDDAPNAMTLLWLSGAITAQGRSDEALGLLSKWLADNPDDVLVRNQLAASYLQLGRESESREQYEEILKIMPDNVLILNNLAWLSRAHDPQRALSYIEKANRLAPDSPHVKDTYAMIQLERNALREALSLSEKALELMPDNTQILYHRAVILGADGQNSEAIQILEKLVNKPDFAQHDEARSLLDQLRGS